jgi:hypothetical protein
VLAIATSRSRPFHINRRQTEVDGLIAFYKTAAGQALIDKMPVVMQNTMTEMQQMMQPMMQRIQRMHQEIVAEIQAQKKKSGG